MTDSGSFNTSSAMCDTSPAASSYPSGAPELYALFLVGFVLLDILFSVRVLSIILCLFAIVMSVLLIT